MATQICFFEDHKIARFYPNALTRPLDQMRLGILTIGEKWQCALQTNDITRTLRPWLAGVFDAPPIQSSKTCIWINARLIPSDELVNAIQKLQPGQGLRKDKQIAVAVLDGEQSRSQYQQLQQWTEQLKTQLHVAITAEQLPSDAFENITFNETETGYMLDHAWDLFHHNAEQIIHDLQYVNPKQCFTDANVAAVHTANPSAIYLEEDVQIDPGVILDASQGAIYLGKRSHIMAGAILRGPVAICEHSIVRMGAKIYEGTTAGPHCKLSGEVSQAIFQAYSNKAHDGYIGNSLIGEWVNIGADTNNSNLKNNYSTVKVYDWESGDVRDTGLQFCGLFMADHCKTAINSMLNSGTVCGVSSSILTNNFPPKYIPSFGWVTDVSIDIFELEKALDTARIVMKRRNVKMSAAYEKMLRHLFTVRDGRA